MAANDSYFPGGKPTTPVLLGARGFKGDHKSGGVTLQSPLPVLVPSGSALIRLYSSTDPRSYNGQWWFTPYELAQICDYAGVDARKLSEGRAGGRSGLHGLFALMHEWYRLGSGTATNAKQLGRVRLVVTNAPLLAMYGEGDVAVSADFTRQIKPMQLSTGGRQHAARQLFLPEVWTYAHTLTDVPLADDHTGRAMNALLGATRWSRLPFE